MVSVLSEKILSKLPERVRHKTLDNIVLLSMNMKMMKKTNMCTCSCSLMRLAEVYVLKMKSMS